MDDNLYSDNNGAPDVCENCGAEITYAGTGEYRCSSCGCVMYDNYGKVRNYLELHPKASIADISKDVGVSTAKIRQMVKESRFELTSDSATFLSCEKCGVSIRSGRLCDDCLRESDSISGKFKKKISGIAAPDRNSSSGARRFLK